VLGEVRVERLVRLEVRPLRPDGGVLARDGQRALRSIWRRTFAGRGVLAVLTTVSRHGNVQRTISEPWSSARWTVILSLVISTTCSA